METYGSAFQTKMSSFDNLFDAFYTRMPGILDMKRDKYLPILYYLKGEKQKGF
jgi:hypothetical protein